MHVVRFTGEKGTAIADVGVAFETIRTLARAHGVEKDDASAMRTAERCGVHYATFAD
jgi:hypothetical protein